MSIRIYFLFVLGDVKDLDSLHRMDMDESDAVEDFQAKLEEKYTLKNPAIELWKLNEPASQEDIRNKVVSLKDPSKIGVLMQAFQPLSDYGPWPAKKIHVVVYNLPSEGAMSSLTDSLFTTREVYLKKTLPRNSPSTAAIPSEFSKYQRHNHYPILCNRPSDAISPLPTTLLHSIFGKFLDLRDTHEPTAQDNELAMDISVEMSNVFPEEGSRAARFCSLMCRAGITVEDGSVGSSGLRRIDGHHRYLDFPLLIVEAKNEVGSEGGAEPFFQAICYYGKFLQEKANIWKHHSVFPCFHIILCGPCIAISSSAFTTKIHSDILGPMIPVFTHPTDERMQRLTARTLGALRVVLKELESYYKALIKEADVQARPFNPDCPYPNSYVDQSGRKCDFIYNGSQPNRGKRVFFAKVQSGEEICVKFVKQYSFEAHQLCAEMGCAPQLLGYESLAGGWKMVVMQVLNIFESKLGPAPPNSYHQLTYERDAVENPRPLWNAIEALITYLHSKGYVHGDLRDKNVFVLNDTTSPTDFMLLDFDWSGKIGRARYPVLVNRRQVRRPKGAIDGRKILADHDLKMLQYMFAPPRTGPADEEMVLDAPEV